MKTITKQERLENLEKFLEQRKQVVLAAERTNYTNVVDLVIKKQIYNEQDFSLNHRY